MMGPDLLAYERVIQRKGGDRDHRIPNNLPLRRGEMTRTGIREELTGTVGSSSNTPRTPEPCVSSSRGRTGQGQLFWGCVQPLHAKWIHNPTGQ